MVAKKPGDPTKSLVNEREKPTTKMPTERVVSTIKDMATLAPPPKKSRKVKIRVSLYRVNDKIISALGIPTSDAPVVHRFPKHKLKTEDLFILATQIKNHLPFSKIDSYKPVVEQILNEKTIEIVLPETRANKLQDIGIFIHQILDIEIELLV